MVSGIGWKKLELRLFAHSLPFGRGCQHPVECALHLLPAIPQGPHSPADRPLLFQPEGWEHQTSAHHGQTSPGVEDRSAELQSCWITTAGAGGLQRDTGVLPPALSQGQRRRRYPHPKSRKFCSSSPRSSSTCPLAASPWEE